MYNPKGWVIKKRIEYILNEYGQRETDTERERIYAYTWRVAVFPVITSE